MPTLRLLFLLLLPPLLTAQDKLKFIAPLQTSTKAPLRVRMERVKRWDDKAQRWVEDPTSLGSLEVRVWKFGAGSPGKPHRVSMNQEGHRTPHYLNARGTEEPASAPEFIRDAFEMYPREIPEFIAMVGGQIGAYDQYGRRYGIYSKQHRFDESAREYETSVVAEDGAEFLIPGREAGRYAVELKRGSDRAWLKWDVNDLLLDIEQDGATVRFSGLNSADGKPLPGAALEVGMRIPEPDPKGPEGKLRWVEVTKSLKLDSKGQAEVIVPSRGGIWTATLKQGDASLLVNLDVSFETYGPRSSNELKGRATQGLLYSDRPIYRPGEEVFLKFLLHSPGLDPNEDLVGAYGVLEPQQSSWVKPFGSRESNSRPLTPEQLRSVGVGFRIEPMDYRGSQNFGNELRGFLSLTNVDLTTFSGGIKLPETLSPGTYRASVESNFGSVGVVSFEVLDYQKPRFKVAIQSPSTPPPAGKLQFGVRARAMDGSPVPKATGEWSLFRILEPTLTSWFDDRPQVELKESRSISLDDEGMGLVDFDEAQVDPRFRYRLLVKVTDAGGQRQMASLPLGNENGGLRVLVDRAFAEPGESLQVKVGSDEPLGNIHLSVHLAEGAERTFWDSQSGLRAGRKVADLLATGDKLRLPIGAYILVAEGQLATGVRVRADRFFLVGGEGSTLPTTRILRAASDREIFKTGEPIRVLVLLPKPGLTLTWNVEGEGRTQAAVRKVKGTTAILEIPVGEREYPNGWITISTACEGRFMSRVIPFGLNKERERLDIEIKPSQPAYLPGQEATLEVRVKDFGKGKGGSAEISLAVVDDALFALAPDQLPDPVGVFHPDRIPAISRGQSFEGYQSDSLSETVQVYLGQASNGAAAAMVDASSASVSANVSRDNLTLANLAPGVVGGESPTPAKHSQAWKDLRDHFLDSALWIPSLPVEGTAVVKVPLGDDLTTWRATVVGFGKGARSGVGRLAIPVGKPLQIQLVVPPVLVEKDEGRALALVKNRSSERSQGIVQLKGEGVSIEMAEQKFDLRPGQEARLSFPLRALAGVKAGKVSAMAQAGDTKDGETRTLRICSAAVETRRSGAFFLSSTETEWTFTPPAEHEGPSTYSLFAVDKSLERLLSPSLKYLASYPYGCVEQTLSRIVPAALIQELVVKGQMPPLEALDAEHLEYNLKEGLEKLWSMQLPNQTWGWFGARDFHAQSSLHTTGYAIWSLALLSRRKQAEQDYKLEDARSAAITLLNRTRSQSLHPWTQDEAFLLFAISEASNADNVDQRKKIYPLVEGAIASVLEDPKSSSVSLAMISLTAGIWRNQKVAELLRRLEGSARVVNNEVYWPEDHGFLGGEIPTVLALKALCRLHPDSELIPPAEMHLVAKHNGEGWYSTWATAQVLGLIPDLANVRRLRWMGGPDIQLKVEGVGDADFKTAPNPFTFELAPGREVKLKARGEGALVWSVQGGSSKAMVSPQRGDVTLSVKRTIHRLHSPGTAGAVSLGYKRAPWSQSLGLNEEALLEIDVQANRSISYGLVEIPIPAGMEADPELKDFVLEGGRCSQSLWCRSEIHADKVAFFLDHLGRDQPTTLWVRLRARTEGRYRFRPIRFSLMGDENQWVSTEGQDLIIQGPTHD